MDSKKLLQLFSKTAFASLVLVAMMGLQIASAATIFVSSTTGSDAFDGATATISGGSGPKATLAAAYAAAAAGDTISIEAGAYGENFDFGTAAKGVTVVVTPAGAVTVATFAGTSTINITTGTITLNSGTGSIAVAGGTFTLTSGTLALGTGKLAFTAATTLNVTGGTATGASPGYTGAVTANYTKAAAGSAGTEIPANLNGGTLTVNGAFNTTFPATLVAGSVVTAGSATGVTTFSGAVTVTGAVTHNGDDIVFGALNLSNGAVTSAGGGADQTFVAGAVTATQDFAAQGGTITNTAPSAMTLGSLTVNSTIVGAGNGASDPLAYTVANTGTLTVNGAITEGSASDASPETDGAAIALTNSGTATLGASSSISGAFNNTGGTLALGSWTLTLAKDVAAGNNAITGMGTVTGATSTVAVSRDTGVPASTGVAAPAFDIAGSVNISGNGGVVGAISVAGAVTNSGNGAIAAATRTGGNLSNTGNGAVTALVTVGGSLTMAGTGGVNGGGDFDVAGGATFSGNFTIASGATNDIDGAVSVSGAVVLAANTTFGSGSVTSTGGLTINNGITLTMNGDLNTSLGGAFLAGTAANSVADNATLAFVIARGTTATYTPGPNTSVDDLMLSASGTTGTATLVMGQSVAIDENFTTMPNTSVNLGNFLIRHTGNTARAAVGGNMTTPAGQDGALAFEGTTNTLEGLGAISNILVNVGAGNRLAVVAAAAPLAAGPTSIDFTGALSLFTGGVTIAAGSDVSPTGSTAEIRRNAAAAAAVTDIIGAGTVNGDNRTYTLTIFGAGAVTAASELAVTGITTLNVNDTATYTSNKSATVGNVNVAVGATLANGAGFDLTATGTVANAGTVNGAVGDQLILTGDNASHTNTGNINADLSAQASGITVTGTTTLSAGAQAASLTNVIVGDGAAGTGTESLTLTNIQQIDGTVAVASDGSLSLGLVQDDGTAGTGDGDEGSVAGAITVTDGGSITLTTNVRGQAAVTVGTLGDTAVPTFNFNGNEFNMGAAAFAADWNANLGTSGNLELDAAGTVTTNANNATPSTPTSALPGLQVDVASALAGNTRVVGLTDVNAALTGGFGLTVSGTMNVGAGITNNVTIIGTTVNIEGAQTLTGSLTVNATSVDFVGTTAAADSWSITLFYTHTAGAVSQTNTDINVAGTFTQTAGNYTLTGSDLNLAGAATYVAGTFSAAGSGDEVRFRGAVAAVNTSGTTWTIPNVDVERAVVIDGAAGTAADGLTIGNRLELAAAAGLTAGNGSGAGTPTGTITLGDGSGTLYIDAAGGTIADAGADGSVVYGSDTTTIEYNGTSPSTLELFTTFDTLIINAAVALADARAVTVNNIDINAVGSDIDANNDGDNSITLTADGTVNFGVGGAPFVGPETFTPAAITDYNLIYDSPSVTTTAQEWAATWTPDVTVSGNGAGVQTVTMGGSRGATSLTMNGAGPDVLELGGFTLSVSGAVTLNGVATVTNVVGGGALAFTGTAVQTLAGGLTLAGVTVNNPAGLTLTGGDLNTSGTVSGTACLAPGTNGLTLTNGVITTGANRVIICHASTTVQGYTRTNGVVFGNVQVTVDGTAPLNTTDRVQFPLGDALGNWRPYAITFNSPANLASDPTLVASYEETNPGGTNGLPVAAVDDLGANFTVSRYPDFHWKVTSAPTVTPSISYDVEYRADGYANFAVEDIEKTRAIRRQDGSTANFWIKVANGASDNDNFAVSADEPVMVARNAVGAINADGVLFTIGLENNLAGSAIADATVNAGTSTPGVDLSTIFSGGDRAGAAPTYTYAVSGGDAAVATGATAGDTFTITGVAAGSTTFTITATDSFGSTATATATVTVNEAFAAGTDLADLAAVNVGAADATVDGSGSHQGGTAPVTYTVATSDAAVATATVDGAGSITVTYVGAGTATITLTATDALGSTVVDSFDVTVNSAVSAGGTLTNQSVNNGATVDQDVSGEFSGGTGGFTYTAASGDADVATAAASGSTVTTTGVNPYVITAGAVTADAAPATITVTATDALGSTVSSTFDVEVNPVLGNVDGSGGVSPASASLALDSFLGLATLTAKQWTAADYNIDAAVTPFDAALIFDAWLNPTPGAASKKEFAANPASDVAFGEVNMQVTKVTIPVTLTGDQAAAVSFSFETSINAELASVTGVTGTIEGWTVRHFVGEDGILRIAGFGFEAIPSNGVVANISLELTDVGTEFALRGQGAVNNNPATEIEGIDVVELPENFALLGNYPNPFNPSTNISFDLPASADVSIEVYDMLGRRVMVLPMQTIQAGSKRSVQLNASQLASGSYFYRVIAQMESKTQVDNGRMMLIK